LARRISAGLLLLSITSFVPTAALAAAASPSELLERGIYSEETKGDVDAALSLYQQVVKEAKAGQAVAAQAQYRLGICYYKKKNYTDANAAFEKLVADYPDQKDLIALANKYLAGAMPLLPAPWVDGEEMRLDIKFPTGFKLGTACYRVNAGESNGRKVWRLSSRLYAGTQQASRVEVEAESFKPIHCWWKISVMGEVDVSYFPSYAEIRTPAGKEPKKVDLKGVVYDNEEAMQLGRRLPLAPDYQTTVSIFTGLGGGNIIPLGIKVVAQEKVETPAGTFDCYKLELSPVGQTFWISTDAHHYMVKFEAGGVIAELTQVTQRKAGEPVQYHDPDYGFLLTAPADWVFFHTDAKEDKAASRVILLDPEAIATTLVNVGSRKDHGPKPEMSLREWAEKEVVEGEAEKVLKALKIRTESWKERTVDGQPAVSVMGDFEEAKEKKVGYAVLFAGKTNSAVLTLISPAKDFEAAQPKFEAIVDSYKEK
jgi:hypothetical protein